MRCFQFALIHGPNIPGSYAILLFTASNLASITSPIYNWVLFLLWLHPFILSGVISPLISSSIYWVPTDLGSSSFSVLSFCFFILFMGFSQGKNTVRVWPSLLQWTTFYQAVVFPVVRYGLDHKESWEPKNWCFWTVVLEKTLESPLDCKEIQPVHPKGISPGCSLEGLMLKLQLQYFGHLMRRADSFEKTLMLGKIEGRRRRGQQRMRWLDGITNSMDMGLGGL